MKTTQEMIAVMQAYVDGKKIECYNKIDSTKEKISIMRSYAEGKETETIDANVTNTVIFDSPIWGPLWDWIHYDYQIKEEQFTPKFNIGDLVVDNKYQNKMVILRYEGNKPVVYYANEEVAVDENVLELYKELTREEITAQWVKANDVKRGDFVKYIGDDGFDNSFAEFNHACNYRLQIVGIEKDLIWVGKDYKIFNFKVEDLKKITKKIAPFTFEDRELFRDKWVINRGYSPEFKIITIDLYGVILGYSDKTSHKTYEEMVKYFEFIDRTPFGKEIWE